MTNPFKRLSINGHSYDAKDSGSVRFDESMSLTDEQKEIARNNIGAGTGGGGGGDVESVNGQTGVVVLDAEDVGALPSDTVIPSKTSDLQNDSGFITSGEAPVQSVNGQTGSVQLSIPSKTSDLQNDSGFITSAPVQSVNGQTGAVQLSIPSKTSDLQNDSGFITSANVPEADSSTPQGLGSASAGSSNKFSRGDHVHQFPDYVHVGSSAPSDGNIDIWLDTSGVGQSAVTSVNGANGTVVLDADDVGAMSKWVLLWTNASPSSSFAEQTITINNISDYDWIAIKVSNSSGTIFIRNDGEMVQAEVFGYMGSNNMAFRYREITSPSTTGVLFSDCKQGVVGATSYTYTTRNDTTIPLSIWGIKGVTV